MGLPYGENFRILTWTVFLWLYPSDRQTDRRTGVKRRNVTSQVLVQESFLFTIVCCSNLWRIAWWSLVVSWPEMICVKIKSLLLFTRIILIFYEIFVEADSLLYPTVIACFPTLLADNPLWCAWDSLRSSWKVSQFSIVYTKPPLNRIFDGYANFVDRVLIR